MATRWATGIWKARAVAELARHEWGKSEKQTPQLGVVLNVLQPHGTKREGVAYLSFSIDAKEWSAQRLRLLGVQGSDLRKLDGIDRNYVDVDVSYETFDGKERLRIDIVTPARAQHKHALSASELDALSGMVKHDLDRLPEVTLPVPDRAKKNSVDAPPEDFPPEGALAADFG